MNRSRGGVVIGLLGVILMFINSCCDEGYSYKWHGIILQNYSGNELASQEEIKKSEFVLRVYLINSKTSENKICFPKLIDNAYANDCMGTYLNVDKISDIDIYLLTEENGTLQLNNLTFQFDAILDNSSGNKIQVFDLPERINKEKSQPVDYFDLALNESFDESASGKFVVEIELNDNHTISDTTETLSIVL